ncbi:MAG: L,D-transpeptidase, partial [Nostocales cyanobacterium]
EIFEAGTDSPLGDRWIGFWSDGKNEIGFHGTPNTDLIGAAVSHGCLRMRNADVRMLYEQVSLDTPVVVRD